MVQQVSRYISRHVRRSGRMNSPNCQKLDDDLFLSHHQTFKTLLHLVVFQVAHLNSQLVVAGTQVPCSNIMNRLSVIGMKRY